MGRIGTSRRGLIAGLIVVRIGHRMTRRWLYGGGSIGLGCADLGAANTRLIASAGTPAVGTAMGWMIVAGSPAVASMAGQQALVQTQTTDAYRGRVYGALISVQGVAFVIGLTLGGVFGDRIGIVEVLSAGALMRVLGGVVAVIFLPRDERQNTTAIEGVSMSSGMASSQER